MLRLQFLSICTAFLECRGLDVELDVWDDPSCDKLGAVTDPVSRFHSEPPVGSVLSYTVTFSDGRSYTYVAYKAPDSRWYLTGKSTFPFSWCSVEEKIGNNPCHVVSGWIEIPLLPESATIDPTEWAKRLNQ